MFASFCGMMRFLFYLFELGNNERIRVGFQIIFRKKNQFNLGKLRLKARQKPLKKLKFQNSHTEKFPTFTSEQTKNKNR